MMNQQSIISARNLEMAEDISQIKGLEEDLVSLSEEIDFTLNLQTTQANSGHKSNCKEVNRMNNKRNDFHFCVAKENKNSKESEGKSVVDSIMPPSIYQTSINL